MYQIINGELKARKPRRMNYQAGNSLVKQSTPALPQLIGLAGELVKHAGMERRVFGSDYTFHPYQARLSELRIVCKPIPETINQYAPIYGEAMGRSRGFVAGFYGNLQSDKRHAGALQAGGYPLLHLLLGWPGIGDWVKCAHGALESLPEAMRREYRILLTRLGVFRVLSFNDSVMPAIIPAWGRQGEVSL
jgi:hypothetical protein